MKCLTRWCRGKRDSGAKHCSKCRKRKQKRDNPFQYYYNISKQNAKRRGHYWSLTLSQYKDLWLADPAKWISKINGDRLWSIDRIDVTKGYQFDNVQIIEVWRNVTKWFEHDRFCIDVKYLPSPTSNDNNTPF